MKNSIRRILMAWAVLAVIMTVTPLAQSFAAGKALPTQTINVNTASAQELTALPGIGKAKADAIVTYREAHPFKDVSELTEVKGIGPKMLEKLQAYVTVEGNGQPVTASASPTK